MGDEADREAISGLRAMAHPLRVRMLSLLTGAAMSAAEVARELDLTHANASYHLRTLADAGLIGEAGEEKVRGGTAKRYRYLVETSSRPDGPPRSTDDRLAYLQATHAEVVRRNASSGRGPSNFTDLETWVRPEVWSEAVELIVRASMLLHDQAQRPRTEGTIHVSATVHAFVMRDDR